MSVTRRKPGRLGPFVEGYRVWLLETGYTPQTVRWMLRDLSRLGRWMDAEDVAIGALTVSGVESWLAARRAAGGYRVPTVRALRALLSYLGEVGVMGEEEPLELSPVEALVDGYRHWLIADRGLAAMTVLRYETLARRFLAARVTSTDELGVVGVDGAVVSRFLLGECDRVCLGSAKGKVAELRSLLRFLHVRGFTPRSLAESVPGVAGWRETGIPPTMPQADIEALLANCDRSTLDGARDRAMLMLLARLASSPQRSEALGVPGPGHLCRPSFGRGRSEQPLQAGADQVGADRGEQAAGYHPLVPAAHRDPCLPRPADREVAPVHPAVVPGAAGRPPLPPGLSRLALQPPQHETQAAETVLLGSCPLGDERWPGQPLPQLGATQAGRGPHLGHLAGREPLKQQVSGSSAGTSGQRSCDR